MWEPFDQKYDINLSQTMAFNFSPYGFLATFADSPFILCGMVNAIPVQISKKCAQLFVPLQSMFILDIF